MEGIGQVRRNEVGFKLAYLSWIPNATSGPDEICASRKLTSQCSGTPSIAGRACCCTAGSNCDHTMACTTSECFGQAADGEVRGGS